MLSSTNEKKSKLKQPTAHKYVLWSYIYEIWTSWNL